MGLPLKKDDREYTCKDYWSWPEDERWELIDPGNRYIRVFRLIRAGFHTPKLASNIWIDERKHVGSFEPKLY